MAIVRVVTGSTSVASVADQSGTTYTLASADTNAIIRFTSASAITVTVPSNSSVSIPIGTMIDVSQWGAGQVTVAAGSGVTIRTVGSLATRTQYSGLSLTKVATDEWWLAGDTA